jgi:hypothetical protein
MPTAVGFSPVSRSAGIAIFAKLAERWHIPRGEWHVLLGRDSPNTIRNWEKASGNAPLDADVQERLSHLVAIYDALHRIFGDSTFADEWIRVGNDAFGGDAPVTRLFSGRFADLYEVRLYLERSLAR